MKTAKEMFEELGCEFNNNDMKICQEVINK